MENNEIKLLNLLPCGMGKDFEKKVKTIGFKVDDASIILSKLMEEGLAITNENNIYVVTEKGLKEIHKEGQEAKSELNNLEYQKITNDVLGKVVWDSKRTKFHPAMDFIDRAFTTIFLVFRDDELKTETERAVVITSLKECFPIERLPEEFVLEEQPIRTETWLERGKLSKYPSQDTLRLFLEGDAKINLLKLFNDVRDKFVYFMDFEDKRYFSLVSIWAIGTFFHQLFSTYPYLFLNAIKRSGKTKLMTLIGFMSFNPEPFIAPSSASFYRIIQAEKPTLLIDEIERLPKKEASDIRSIILSGYKKGFTVPRIEEVKEGKEKRYRTVKYDIFSPKVMANIAGIEETIADRSIPIILTRSLDKTISNREPRKLVTDFQPIRNDLFLAQMLVWKDIKFSYELFGDLLEGKTKDDELNEEVEKIKNDVSSRHWELWQPMFGIANAISKDVLKEIVGLAIDITKEKEVEEEVDSFDASLVRIICSAVDKSDWYGIADITKHIRAGEDFEKLSSEQVGRALSRLKLVSGRKHTKNRRCVYIKLDTLKNCAKRVGLDYDEVRFEETVSDISPKKDRLLRIIKILDEKYPNGIEMSAIFTDGLRIYENEQLVDILDKFHTEGIIFYPKPNKVSLIKKTAKTIEEREQTTLSDDVLE